MAELTEDGWGEVAITLSSGYQVRLPGITPAGREPNIQDIKNLATALIALTKNLDDRLVKLEKVHE
jgi:hypothetical protein